MTTTSRLTPLIRSDVPAGAYDDHLARTLPLTREQPEWTPSDGALPSLFVSHGAPFTLDDPQWLGDLFGWARSLPKPKAIVVVSAHWEQAPAAISGTTAGTPLLYDFSGFHPRFKTLPYATPDAADLGRRVAGALFRATVHDTGRGLDHGAFIPLMAMYPAADVPVVQLSMPSTAAWTSPQARTPSADRSMSCSTTCASARTTRRHCPGSSRAAGSSPAPPARCPRTPPAPCGPRACGSAATLTS